MNIDWRYYFYAILIILGLVILGLIISRIRNLLPRRIGKVLVDTSDDNFKPAKEENIKVVFILIILFLLSAIAWTLKYIVENNSQPNSLLSEILSAVFSVTTAAFIGGIVFELLLRKNLLNEVSHTLADIITTDKKVIKEMFTSEKRNKIIETILQVQLDNDVYGTAISSDLLSHYFQSKEKSKQFRFDFSDHVTLSRIAKQQTGLLKNYYEVNDRIRFKTELTPYPNFIFGCARDENGLYEYFNNPSFIYRWLLKDPSFEELIKSGYGFNAKLNVGGLECKKTRDGVISDQGYELYFENPFVSPNANLDTKSKIGQLVEFDLEISTLQLSSERAVTIHLAYPVKGVDVLLDYDNTTIQQVTWLHFMTAGENKPRITEGVQPQFSKRKRTIAVNISNDHWLFPDSGIMFFW